jgi:hypothetical protein
MKLLMDIAMSVSQSTLTILKRKKEGGSMPKPRIVIFVEGGLIQDVCSNVPVDVNVLDADVEGTEDDYPSVMLLETWDDKRGGRTGDKESYFVGQWRITEKLVCKISESSKAKGVEENLVDFYWRQTEEREVR